MAPPNTPPTQSAQGEEGLEAEKGSPISLKEPPGTAGLGHLHSRPRTDQIEQTTGKLLCGVKWGS